MMVVRCILTLPSKEKEEEEKKKRKKERKGAEKSLDTVRSITHIIRASVDIFQ
jgi:hypothetical protein